ncbi:MAG: hypothetical protein U9Q66_00145 [Patescibacteria group bacterium]|nr:hypothetical protein [Patescibacteria group bacterium]
MSPYQKPSFSMILIQSFSKLCLLSGILTQTISIWDCKTTVSLSSYQLVDGTVTSIFHSSSIFDLYHSFSAQSLTQDIAQTSFFEHLGIFDNSSKYFNVLVNIIY